MNNKSDIITLSDHESNAAFIGVRHVDIFRVKGLEFHHLFIIVLMRDPSKLESRFSKRLPLFYNVRTRDLKETEVIYFSNSNDKIVEDTWETTISASSECGYDPKATKLGSLINVPNFDRLSNDSIGKRIYSKKIVSNEMKIVNLMFEFEERYNDSLSYSLLPEVLPGYNSNSYFRGVLEYVGLGDAYSVPSCFRAPGLSKPVLLE